MGGAANQKSTRHAGTCGVSTNVSWLDVPVQVLPDMRRAAGVLVLTEDALLRLELGTSRRFGDGGPLDFCAVEISHWNVSPINFVGLCHTSRCSLGVYH